MISKRFPTVCRHPAVHACYRVTGPSLLVLMVRLADNTALTAMLAGILPVRRDQDRGHPVDRSRRPADLRRSFATERGLSFRTKSPFRASIVVI